jgi:hypothetical protein
MMAKKTKMNPKPRTDVKPTEQGDFSPEEIKAAEAALDQIAREDEHKEQKK